MSLFYITEKVACFSKVYYNKIFQDLTLSDTNMTPTSEVRPNTMWWYKIHN
jgi:hypothetical protein